jgi:hypothetical protein
VKFWIGILASGVGRRQWRKSDSFVQSGSARGQENRALWFERSRREWMRTERKWQVVGFEEKGDWEGRSLTWFKLKGRGGYLQRDPTGRAATALRGMLLVAEPGRVGRSRGAAGWMCRHHIFVERRGTGPLGHGRFNDDSLKSASDASAVILWSPVSARHGFGVHPGRGTAHRPNQAAG